MLLSFSSCSNFISRIEGANQNKKFKNVEIYFDYVINSLHIPKEKLIILNDFSFQEFQKEIIENKLAMYYAIFDKESYVSCNKLEDKSCSGQVINLYHQFNKKIIDTMKIDNDKLTLISKFNLDSSKKTLIFIYSYKLGKLVNSKIVSVINELIHEKDFDYRIISIDNYDIFKN